MLSSSPPPSKSISKYAPIIYVMKVPPEKINLIIGFGGKRVKSIIEETGVENIDTQDNGLVKITARDLSSLERTKAIISSLIMVPSVGDIYRNCEIKSITPYGVFVEIAPGREGLCHISELSTNWLAKAEDAFKVGDRVDVKLIEVNEKGQLRLSRRALLPDNDKENSAKETSQKASDKNKPKTASSTPKNASRVENSEMSKGKGIAVKGPEKDGPNTDKEVQKRSSKSASAMVNGDVKIGS